MKPSSALLAAVLLAAGTCGILDAAGIVPWSETVGQWWPLAIAGWAVADMATTGRVTLWGAICTAAGVALLADVQAWTSDTVVWSTFALFAGAAVLVEAVLRRHETSGDETRAAAGSGASS